MKTKTNAKRKNEATFETKTEVTTKGNRGKQKLNENKVNTRIIMMTSQKKPDLKTKARPKLKGRDTKHCKMTGKISMKN